jgi:hypothetical protein
MYALLAPSPPRIPLISSTALHWRHTLHISCSPSPPYSLAFRAIVVPGGRHTLEAATAQVDGDACQDPGCNTLGICLRLSIEYGPH